MRRGVEVTLPRGVRVGGERRRDAAVRPVAGADEVSLLDGDALSPVERSTALLARCVVRLGDVDAPGADAVRDLCAGDREALLLHVRRVTLGDGIDLVLACPRCGEPLDLELRTAELLVPAYADVRERHELVIDGAVVSFRLPTGRDLEAAARVGAVDAEQAAGLVLERCAGEALTGTAAAAVSARMAELDPQAEIVLEMPCAVCEHRFSVALDAGDLLARELTGRGDVLLREIHLLALHYGWPESELLEMTSRRRRRYVAYLTEALAR